MYYWAKKTQFANMFDNNPKTTKFTVGNYKIVLALPFPATTNVSIPLSYSNNFDEVSRSARMGNVG